MLCCAVLQVGMIDALTEADIEAAVERKVVTREMVGV